MDYGDDDDVPALAGRRLPGDEIRQKLRLHGMSAERVNSLSDRDAYLALGDYVSDLDRYQEHLRRAPDLVKAGALTPRELDSMSKKDLHTRVRQFDTLAAYDRVTGRDQRPTNQTLEKASAEYKQRVVEDRAVTHAELLPVLGDILELVASQAVEIRELRQEVRRLSELQFAVFGKQEIFEQLRRMAKTHDVSGFRADMTLTEQISVSETGASTEEETREANVARDNEMFGKISGIATYIAGLDAGGKVNFDAMERSVRRAKKTFERSLQSKTVGAVSIQVEKLEKPRSDK